MNAIYRTHFQVKGKQPGPQLATAVADICWKWLFDPKRNYVAPSPAPSGCISAPMMALSTTAKAEAMAVTDNGSDLWVLALSHADGRDASGIWRTEIGIERTATGQVFFSCSLCLGRTNRSVAPFRRATSRPNIVLEVLKQFEGCGAAPLTYKPIHLKPDPAYVDALVKMLQDPRRHHPVVYVSTHEQSGRPFFDVSTLAKHLAGTAYVVVAENLDACRAFRQRMPPQLQAFDGAVRIYWPGFSPNANPFEHPLWTKHRIMTIQTRGRDAFSKRLLAQIAAVAVTSMPESLLTWAKATEKVRHHAIAHAKSAKDVTELLKLYEEDNATLRVRVAGLEKELQTKGEDLYRAHSRITALENVAEQEDKGEALSPVENVADAIEQAGHRWPEELQFALNSKSDDEGPFQPATEVLNALEWLATTYYQAKLGKTKVTNLNLSLREKLSSWTHKPHQGDTTLTTHKEWYECHWQGCAYTVSEHVGTGSSKRPEETIRIGFAWDKVHKKVIIGFIGQHQKNTKS